MKELIQRIKTAYTTVLVGRLVDQALEQRGCEMDPSRTYEEAAKWFRVEGIDDVAEVLEAAATRWNQLEQ
jgi:hypothetical protein